MAHTALAHEGRLCARRLQEIEGARSGDLDDGDVIRAGQAGRRANGANLFVDAHGSSPRSRMTVSTMPLTLRRPSLIGSSPSSLIPRSDSRPTMTSTASNE